MWAGKPTELAGSIPCSAGIEYTSKSVDFTNLEKFHDSYFETHFSLKKKPNRNELLAPRTPLVASTKLRCQEDGANPAAKPVNFSGNDYEMGPGSSYKCSLWGPL